MYNFKKLDSSVRSRDPSNLLESIESVTIELSCFVLGYYIATDSQDSKSLRPLDLCI